jgi:dihydroorotate dehydrogenase
VTDLFGLARPAISQLDPELAHDIAVSMLGRASRSSRALRWLEKRAGPDDPRLAVDLFGTPLPNPLIAAAGLDKNGSAAAALHALGFGLVEVGTVTLRPQPGNPKPRVFRLEDDRALVNRMGFPSRGVDVVAANLAGAPRRPFALNVGPNKERVDRTAEDCAATIRRLAVFGPRYLTLNISSPNTAGLRSLQSAPVLTELVSRIKAELPASAAAIPLLVKIAPEIGDRDLEGIVRVVEDAGLGGIVATNTTTRRPPGMTSRRAREQGGLSGKPLAPYADRVIERIARLTNGTVTILAAGGVFTGADVARKIELGATAVQLYTGFTYGGPGLPSRLKRELLAELDRRGLPDLKSLRGAAIVRD